MTLRETVEKLLGLKPVPEVVDTWREVGSLVGPHLITQSLNGDNLFSPEDSRYSSTVGNLLARLWHSDDAARNGHRSKAPMPDDIQSHYFGVDLTDRLQSLPPPDGPKARYETVLRALQMLLRENQEEMESTDSPFPILHVAYVVQLIRQLLAVELHGDLCRLLVTTRKTEIKEREGSRSAALLQLAWDIEACLLSLPPNHVPEFWAMLAEPRTSSEFWPIVGRMGHKSAVPLLIDVFPKLSLDGQSRILIALENIGDTRALPLFRRLVARPDSMLSMQAARALKNLLKNSGDDAAMLLRASDGANVGNPGDILLRPAAPDPNAGTSADELLRPHESPTP